MYRVYIVKITINLKTAKKKKKKKKEEKLGHLQHIRPILVSIVKSDLM
jgi:hypothetical protein